MIGALTREQMEHVLRSGLIGRIGCSDETGVYIVPVNYAYDGIYIYAHSREGLKVEIMRKNPSVCFQVDSIENLTNWRSVVIRGKFKEMKMESEREKAVRILKDRLMPYLLSETMRPVEAGDKPMQVEKEQQPVLYRISIDNISGRYEKNAYLCSLSKQW